tara:strand:+ start:74 stop:832 length:759 start_codon:yes stop_codon:yes gene_type:complete
MDNYIQDLFSKDDIGFKPVNDVKDSTKIFVFKLNKFIKDRDGKNITRTEIIRLAEEINELGDKIRAKMNQLFNELKSKKDTTKSEEEKTETDKDNRQKSSEIKSSALIGQDISNVTMVNDKEETKKDEPEAAEEQDLKQDEPEATEEQDSEKDEQELNEEQESDQQTGGNIEFSVPEVSTIDLLNSVNNVPCSASVTQCGDYVTSCGQSGGGNSEETNYKLFELSLNANKKFNISESNKKILYDFVKLYSFN